MNGHSGQLIVSVDKGSPAAALGLKAGEFLLSINGETVNDLIDYTHLCSVSRLRLRVADAAGEARELVLHKPPEQGLGLSFESTLMSNIRTCRNRCVFCFIDQMPKGTRKTLHFKDDDWRMSFIMGNYVSLTNVSDEEFDRILRRKVSPLYVSVHSTNPTLRQKLMGNPTAGMIMERLKALAATGIDFHTQIVLCPGINDGAELERSLTELAALYPHCASVAVVPVGLTRFREGLFPLRGYTCEESLEVIAQVSTWQKSFTERHGCNIVWLSDEWYLNAGLELPADSDYGDYSQIENGVGLLRLFESELYAELEERIPRKLPVHFTVASGMAAAPFFQKLYECLKPYGITIDCHPIENRYFGGNVHVAGLVTGSDLIEQLRDGDHSETLLIPGNMLRERECSFLDGMNIDDVEKELNTRLIAFHNAAELCTAVFED